jgi:hypothetical protein
MKMFMRRIAIAGFGLALMGATVWADENEWLRPLGPPPKASPKRISGGEGVPPLPLPATPLRRSERKREPKAPTLFAKVIWGESAAFKYDTGQTAEVADWNQCPADLQQLLKKAGNAVGQPYTTDAVKLTSFDGDPVKTPVLFFSGSRSIKFSPEQLALLRNYVLAGGTIVADNIAGSPYFYASFREALGKAFPETPWRTVPLDHPLFHMLYDVTKVRYPKNVSGNLPELETLYVGCRAAVILSKFGLGCGWDDREVPLIPKAAYYDVGSANKLGMNLVAYILGYAHVGREEAKPELFGALDEKRPTDELVFGQLRHEGHWNVHPGGAAALLRALRQQTSVRTSLKRVPITAGKEDLSGFTFLYLTGLDDFTLDAAAVTALQNFLRGNGTLFINNGLGLKTFDAAVRRELRKVLPESVLEPVPVTHPLFSSVFKITEAQYTPAVLKEHRDLRAPYLEGIAINGDLRVIYSPFDLEAGWLGCEHPLARAYEPQSAAQLGVNLVLYAVTH